jgi:hypothetical protein
MNATAKSQTSRAASNVPSHLSKMSESRRTRLEEIQKREQLKGMLITKFLKKYGKNSKELQSYIDSQVQQFMTANRLTEANLRDLDEKIQKEKASLEKKEAAKLYKTQEAEAEVKSQAGSIASKRPSTAKPASVRQQSHTN